MPTLRHLDDRHEVVARKRGRYLSFPDVALADDGGLLALFRQAKAHVGQGEQRLLACRRPAGPHADGAGWTPPRFMTGYTGHCPRLSRLPGEGLVGIDDSPGSLLLPRASRRGGLPEWTALPTQGLRHGLLDRILPLSDGAWFTTGHLHAGEATPLIGQRPTEQIAYRSADRGRTWEALATVAGPGPLVLCEGSTVRLPDGSLLMIMRENSFVYEPMYTAQSFDDGHAWTAPHPTPLIGHRPTMALTRSGKLLVTYRNVAPLPGTAAFLGEPWELGARSHPGAAPDPRAGFQAHGHTAAGYDPHASAGPRLAADGLLLEEPALYVLRPLTDPAACRATVEAWVRVLDGGPWHAGLRLGVWWQLSPRGIRPNLPGARPLALRPDAINHIRLEYSPGQVECHVNGRHKKTISVPPQERLTRPVCVGSRSMGKEGQGRSLWQRLRARVEGAAEGQGVWHWDWTPEAGQPDQWMRRRVLELLPVHGASWADMGYSGWVEDAPGEFYCVYHHADGRERGYRPGRRSWIMGARLRENDFTYL